MISSPDLRSENEIGQTVVEYAMVVGFVCLLVVGILAGLVPGWLTTLTGNITDALTAALG